MSICSFPRYKYDFPFLETNGVVTVDDNRVGPLYKHVFPPALAPCLSFVGLPWKVAPFPLFELQSKWIAGVLSNRIALPSEEEMTKDIEAFYLSLEESGIPKWHTHNMGTGPANVQVPLYLFCYIKFLLGCFFLYYSVHMCI